MTMDALMIAYFLGLKERFDRKINRMNQHFKDNRVIEFYFKPTKYEHWKKLTSKSWGENEMDRVFPLLRDFIATNLALISLRA